MFIYSSLYLDTKGEPKVLKSVDCFSLRTNLSFSRRLTLKFPRKQTSFLWKSLFQVVKECFGKSICIRWFIKIPVEIGFIFGISN